MGEGRVCKTHRGAYGGGAGVESGCRNRAIKMSYYVVPTHNTSVFLQVVSELNSVFLHGGNTMSQCFKLEAFSHFKPINLNKKPQLGGTQINLFLSESSLKLTH